MVFGYHSKDIGNYVLVPLSARECLGSYYESIQISKTESGV